MAVLGPARKVLANRLIAWDRARVARRKAEGYDTSPYEARINVAEAAIDQDVNTWTEETKFYFMSLLETTRIGGKVREQGVGPLPVTCPRLNLAERLLYRALASDIGVIERLRETAPIQWAEQDMEGD